MFTKIGRFFFFASAIPTDQLFQFTPDCAIVKLAAPRNKINKRPFLTTDMAFM